MDEMSLVGSETLYLELPILGPPEIHLSLQIVMDVIFEDILLIKHVPEGREDEGIENDLILEIARFEDQMVDRAELVALDERLSLEEALRGGSAEFDLI